MTQNKIYTIIGDVHCTLKNLDKVKELFDIAEGLGNDVILLGDLLDTKSIVRSECLNLYIDCMKNSNLKFKVLVGNHDYHHLECFDHSLQPLKSLSNVEVIDQITTDENGFVLFPYRHDVSIIRKVLKEIPDNSIVFGHFDTAGFDYGNGFLCEAGLSLKDFARCKSVISGHFHKYQQEKNLTYLGTPFSHSFGESNQTKYIATFSKDTGLNLIETAFPRHVSKTFDCDGTVDIPGLDTRDYNRIVLVGREENINKFPKDSYAGLNVKYVHDVKTDGKINSIKESSDNLEQFLSWAQEIKRLDKNTTDLGLSILRELNVK
jgi:predicted phosphodiesterase